MTQSYTEITDARVVGPLTEPLRSGGLGAYDPRARELLRYAFAAGAYVAGGTARTLLELRLEGGTANEDAADKARHRLKNSDIDLFFQNRTSINAFIEFVTDRGMYVRPSVTGAAVNIDFDKPKFASSPFDKGVFQVIVLPGSIGDIRDTLAKFDIMNSMVAVNDKHMIFSSDLLELEQRKILHVTNGMSPFTLKRVRKYVDKYGYSSFTVDTSERVVDACLEYYEKAAQGEPHKYLKTNFVFDKHNAKYTLQRLVRLLSSSDLLKASLLFTDDGYNYAFNELVKRSKRRESQNEKSVTSQL